MTIAKARKRLKDAVKKLNRMQNSLVFEVVESEFCIGFENHAKRNPHLSFGVFAHTSLFDEYKEKVDAYTNAMMFAELIIAASRLNDPQAYHNILYRGYYPRLHKR